MKQKNTKIVIILCSFIVLFSCNNENKHFITNANYRTQVKRDFEARKIVSDGRKAELFSIFDQNLSQQECEALQFLYAYMPYSDLADYDGKFFLDQVRYAFKARNYFPWGKNIPEDIFRHFVLVYRVNNENLDTARIYIFNEIKDRIKNMDMYDAALEVNHWCHEKVTYRGSDIRTSAPLATIKTAFGRCGEESTLTVTALRAVGIPARQCYTPRWAHTDDNHAWVEVWVNGKWYFMGACEPDPEFNMGWFARPSTRAMLVHTNVFGKYCGNEDVINKNPLFAKINTTTNYTKTKDIRIKVIDENNNPASNATVKFKLYNYAEFYPIATQKTDSSGIATLRTGLGDLLIWASKNNLYNYEKMDVRKSDSLTIKICRNVGNEYAEMFDIYPPSEIVNDNETPKQKIKENNIRLKCEDSIRNAYLATFPTKGQTLLMKNENLNDEEIWNFVHKSEGNYKEIMSFLDENSKKIDGLLLKEYLTSYSDKDLRDISSATLNEQLTSFDKNKFEKEIYTKGIMPARISNEIVKPWRKYLSKKFNLIFGENTHVEDIIAWINANIKICDEGNYFACPITPQGVFELRHSDKHSRDIFFIAACRALNIPAYLDNATNRIFAYENNKWNNVLFKKENKKTTTGKLTLTYNQNTEIKPQYWTHYTIAKFENSDFVTFDYENDKRLSKFPATLDLVSGYYAITTGMRYSDGTTLAEINFFNIKPNQTITKEIKLRMLVPRQKKYGKIDVLHKINVNGQAISMSKLTKEKSLIVAFIEPELEPTKHVLKEFSDMKEKFEKWGGNILFVTNAYNKNIDTKIYKLPKQSLFIYDKTNSLMNYILDTTKQQFRENYPLIFIINKTGEIIFKTEGYRIGSAELIFKSL